MVKVSERALQELREWVSDAQPEVYVRLMTVMEGG